MAESDYRRLAPACLCQPFAFAKAKRGGARPGAGRKSKFSPEERAERAAAKEARSADRARKRELRQRGCQHEKPIFATTGRQRKACYVCEPKVVGQLTVPRQKTVGSCARCGAEFARIAGAKFCGDACRVASRTAERAAANAAAFVPAALTCRFCDKTFETKYGRDSRRSFCSEGCKLRWCRRTFSNGVAHVRRAKRYGSAWEHVDKWAVFARDRWQCQLCGVKTPREKSGTGARDSPELDHILPLSKGGPHTYSNVQCACRRCNRLKGNKPMGQLLLALAA